MESYGDGEILLHELSTFGVAVVICQFRKEREEARFDGIFSLDDRKNERHDRKSKIAAQKRKKKYVL